MGLINVNTIRLEDFSSRTKPKYGILSHRWTEKEVTYADICGENFQLGVGELKLRGLLDQVRRDDLDYVWIDTCCIDKTSSTELSEAINSMYRWYQDAKLCYVYLHDVDQRGWEMSFSRSEWFTRGWTLQELLAPRKVVFYDRIWQFLGSKSVLANEISQITGIRREALQNGDLSIYSVAQKMAWAAQRVTTRIEDQAYCLIGLFDVNMPLLYGEGERAFVRLQEEIIRHDDDHSIFAWEMEKTQIVSGMLAPSPHHFARCSNVITRLSPLDRRDNFSVTNREPFSMTNRGLSINFSITPWSADTYIARLNCFMPMGFDLLEGHLMGIFLRRLPENDQYLRVNNLEEGVWRGWTWPNHLSRRRWMFVRQKLSSQATENCAKDRVTDFQIRNGCLPRTINTCSSKFLFKERAATRKLGEDGRMLMIDNPAEHGILRKILLTYDFDFNPVCLLLEDPSEVLQQLRKSLEHLCDWSGILLDDFEWKEIENGSCVCSMATKDGIWAFKGHRSWGLIVLLSNFFINVNSWITLRRRPDKQPMRWEFRIHNGASLPMPMVIESSENSPLLKS